MQVAIGRWSTGDATGVAVIAGDRIYRLETLLDGAGAAGWNGPIPADLADAIKAGDRLVDHLEDATERATERGVAADGRLSAGTEAPTGVALVAPLTIQNRVTCLGDVFLSHLAVRNTPVTSAVGIFFKLTQDVVGPWAPIHIQPGHPGYIVGGTELTLVVGTLGRDIPADKVWDHLWGYTVLNDVSMREITKKANIDNKVFEDSSPIGPWLTPKRYLADPRNASLIMRIDGREVQHGNTRDMRFDMADSVSVVSSFHWLRPGDVIATGDIGTTDSLPAGSVVECEVPGVGTLVNPVVQG
jgi:2-keto-4-pentenoate hydratase/2-oxohepta-3-ene-1,7-dioic acid hydratase in catechol pathway